MSISIITVGNNANAGTNLKRFQVTSRDDVASLPTDCAPGSTARPADYSFKFVLSNEGVWTETVSVIAGLTMVSEDTFYADWGTI